VRFSSLAAVAAATPSSSSSSSSAGELVAVRAAQLADAHSVRLEAAQQVRRALAIHSWLLIAELPPPPPLLATGPYRARGWTVWWPGACQLSVS
jgi:hypothetical protein